MKLSEALRIGECAVTPIHGSWIKVRNGKACGACAVGRASLAAGFIPTSLSFDKTSSDWKYNEDLLEIEAFWNKQWPWTREFEMPEMFVNDYPGLDNPVVAAVSDLYECFHMPMAMIADWVATIEPKDAEHDKREENLRTEEALQHPDMCQS
jgi:hypothetical protein